MRKITAYVTGGKATLELQEPIIAEHGASLYVKTATVFWNYMNIRKGFNNFISVDGKKVVLTEGYWTFVQMKRHLKKNGLVFTEYHDGRIRIDLAKGTSSINLRNLAGILGYQQSSDSHTYTPHTSESPVDIHEGLRYLTVSCDLVNQTYNVGPDGERSKVITSLPIDGSGPLLGTTTRYSDIESRVPLDIGRYNGITFTVGSNIGNVPGDVLLEVYVTM
jgi:hypothetical protein